MKKTNFDRYLEKQLADPAFAARFEQAGEAWDVALQLASLRQRAGLLRRTSRVNSRLRNSRSADWNLRVMRDIR